MRALFWISAGLLAWTQVGYGVFLELLRRFRPAADKIPAPSGNVPRVSLIVAAYREEDVIAAKVANALALDWPRDGARGGRRGRRRGRARRRLHGRAGADGRRRRGARAAARSARSARRTRPWRRRAASCWRSRTPTRCGSRGALRRLAAAFADPAVGYACGQVRFVNEAGTNQEGALLALRDVDPRQRVGAGVGHRRERGDLRRAAGRTTCRADTADGPRPRVPVQHGQARAAGGLRARGARPPRRWSRPSRASGRASGG